MGENGVRLPDLFCPGGINSAIKAIRIVLQNKAGEPIRDRVMALNPAPTSEVQATKMINVYTEDGCSPIAVVAFEEKEDGTFIYVDKVKISQAEFDDA